MGDTANPIYYVGSTAPEPKPLDTWCKVGESMTSDENITKRKECFEQTGTYGVQFKIADANGKLCKKMYYSLWQKKSDIFENNLQTDENALTITVNTNEAEEVVYLYIGHRTTENGHPENKSKPEDGVDEAPLFQSKVSKLINGKIEPITVTTNRSWKPWKISTELRDAMIAAEGAYPDAYASPEGGNDTIGIGHKIKDTEIKSKRFTAKGALPPPLSNDQMYSLLDEDVALNGGSDINNLINVPLYSYEMDAIIDLCFNGGKGALSGAASSLFNDIGEAQPANTNKIVLSDLINSGKYSEVPKYLKNHFNTANRKWMRGVQNRRNMDYRMFQNSENAYVMLNDAPKLKTKK